MNPEQSPGDIGRRVAWRREDLGLSRAEVAERSGIIESYVAYLETQPGRPTSQTIVRLARALDTSPADLLGGQALPPPGRGHKAPKARLVPLDEKECLGLMAMGGIGRVAYTTAEGPMILPVNFGLASDGVVFRTEADSPLAAHTEQRVAFEVDGVDEVKSEGWSVVVTGPMHVITDETETELLAEWTGVESWAGGHRDTYVRIDLDHVTGRMIRTD